MQHKILRTAFIALLFILPANFLSAETPPSIPKEASIAHQKEVISDKELGLIYSGRDYKKMEDIAKTGDARAQVWAGMMMQHQANYKQAMHWYILAADQGNFSAIRHAAFLHEQGLGTPTDLSAAVRWYKSGAELGDKGLQISYARALLRGKGTESNETEAFKWFSAAAAQHEETAYMSLARMYAEGKGVEANPVKAYAYAELAQYWVDDSDYDTPKEAETLKEKLEEHLSSAEIKQAEEIIRQVEPEHDRHVFKMNTWSYLIMAIFFGIISVITGTIYGVYWIIKKVVIVFNRRGNPT